MNNNLWGKSAINNIDSSSTIIQSIVKIEQEIMTKDRYINY